MIRKSKSKDPQWDHSLINYTNLVTHFLATMPEDEAMMAAVGSPSRDDFEAVGDLQVLLLTIQGLIPGMKIYDLGCGSGRTAKALERAGWVGTYLGHDIETRLVEYLNRTTNGFEAKAHSELTLLAEDDCIDIVFHWSVFTHLFLEEIFIYLNEIYRVLKPGGHHIFSFLEISDDSHFNQVFTPRVEAFQKKYNLAQLDTFLSKEQIFSLAKNIGFKEISFESGDSSANHPKFWQSLCYMSK